MPARFRILDTEFVVEAEQDQVLDYARAFTTDAYEPERGGSPASAASAPVRVRVTRSPLPEPGPDVVPVHRTKHAYWSFDARAADGGRTTVWPRGIAVTVDAAVEEMTVAVGPDVPAAVAGESLFHAFRGVALYRRDPARGNLLHASAVVLDDAAVLFTGAVNAGKTTMLTHLVLHGGAAPLSNDRVRVTSDPAPVAQSWPSYASFAEGTILAHPELEEAALAYERGDYPLATQRWERPLAADFTKARKRVYPMTWFTDAAGVRYRSDAPLGAVFLCRLSPESGGIALRELSPADDESVLEALAGNTFDDAEPSFLPWHGLRFPAGAPGLDGLLARSRAAGVRFFTLDADPRRLDDVRQALKEVLHA